MKLASWSMFPALLLLLGLTAAPTLAQQTLTCESQDGRYHSCAIDTRGGVELERQLSRAECRYHETWGFNRSVVWVNKGCRATFRVGHPGWSDHSSGSWSGSGHSEVVTCESEGGRRNYCRASTRGGVTLDRQLSRTSCNYGSNWGYDRSGIWVDGGCRATFRLSKGGWGSGGNWGGGQPAQGKVRCESEGGRRNYCNANTRGGVSLDRQLSRATCTFRSTWGYDSGGVWVRNGCRADFRLGRGGTYYDNYDSQSGRRDDDDAAAAAAGVIAVGALAAVIAQSSEKHDKDAIEACEREIESRIREQSGGASVEFVDGKSRKLGNRQRDVNGHGIVTFGRDRRAFTYDCKVDMRTDQALEAEWGYSN